MEGSLCWCIVVNTRCTGVVAFVGRYHLQCFYPWRSAPGHRCFHTGGTEESKWRFFFPVELWRFRYFLWTLSSHVFGACCKLKAASKTYWTLEFGFCCGQLARFSCCARRCAMTFAFWRPQRWIENSVQGLLWNFLIDFGKPSIHSTSLVDHFRGLLGTSLCPDVLMGGMCEAKKAARVRAHAEAYEVCLLGFGWGSIRHGQTPGLG